MKHERIEHDFRRELAPLMAALRKQFEAEDAALLALHPGAPKGTPDDR